MRKWLVMFLAFLLVGVVGTSKATVYVNPEGLGNVLIFPYYNARDSYMSFARIVNVSDYALAVKVRLREGVESREVADFVVCLSPKDQFSFWIVNPELLGLGYDRVTIIRDEKTLGVFGDGDTVTLPNNWTRIDAYNAENAGVKDMDRTYEGYIEVFALYAYKGLHGIDAGMCLKMASGAPVYYEGKQVSPETEKLEELMMGEMFIFGIANPFKTYAYKAVAFYGTDPFKAARDYNGSILGAEYPKITDVANLNDLIKALSKSSVYAFFNLSSFYSGGTDLLFNFALKKAMIDAYAKTADNSSLAKYFTGASCKFTEVTNPKADYTSCCVAYNVSLYDDKEHKLIELSPAARKACTEIAYVPINLRSVRGKTLMETKLTSDTSEIVIPDELVPEGFAMGWVNVQFVNASGDPISEPVFAYEIQGFLNQEFSHIVPASYKIAYSESEGEQPQGGGFDLGGLLDALLGD